MEKSRHFVCEVSGCDKFACKLVQFSEPTAENQNHDVFCGDLITILTCYKHAAGKDFIVSSEKIDQNEALAASLPETQHFYLGLRKKLLQESVIKSVVEHMEPFFDDLGIDKDERENEAVAIICSVISGCVDGEDELVRRGMIACSVRPDNQ